MRHGMTVAHARALLPGETAVEPHRPQRELAALEALGRWALRFSPIVAVDPPDGLLFDIAGCERLFGGERRLVDLIADAVGTRSRSQHRNRAEAHKVLRARLYELELRNREDAAQAEADAKTDIGWGHQIRSYVLHPYQMVKDLRTGVETSNTSAVLDGDLDIFMAAALAARLGDGGK